MSEIASKENYVSDMKLKQTFATRKNPLRVINGNINVLERGPKKLKQSCKRELQNCEQFEVSENDVENETVKYDNAIATASSAVFSSSCFGLSSEICKKVSNASYIKSEKLVWYTPYRQDIHNYFRENEPYFRPKPNYMDRQPSLNMGMRSVLINWFVEVVEEYKMQAETLHLAVSFVDRFLTYVYIVKTKLQLVGTTSLFIASKYEEIHYPELKEFVSITDNSYTKNEILTMEHLMLKTLNFDLSIPTAYTYLQLYFSVCNAPNHVSHFAEYLCELSLLDGIFLKYPPSLIAAGSLAFANSVTRRIIWDSTMESFTGYKLEDLRQICKLFHYAHKRMPSYPQKAIYEKYKTPNHGCASVWKFPDPVFLLASVEK